MICRICSSTRTKKAGTVEYYLERSSPIYDCEECGSRFTEHFDETYEDYHADGNSGYGVYRALTDKTKELFDKGNLVELRRNLLFLTKYKFIIEAVEKYDKSARILEVGCSRGYLTSYFILAGYDVIGSDISRSAVNAARENFGPRFFETSSPEIAGHGPYDVIYHTGTIGCVKDPVGLTRSLLKLLKRGGKLLFNAPNFDACTLKGQLWIDVCPPPDLVTLYKPGFWSKCFSSDADVIEEVENCPSEESLLIGLKRLTGRWRPPKPISIKKSILIYTFREQGTRPMADRLRDGIFDIVRRGLSKLRMLRFVPGQPAPFGLYVTLVKK